ncbi:MAG: hypothetical protein Q4G59_04450, partial [Planctomycetia bacterium]|nr:hypothetical protein [Planctomycetia bacterium]
VRLAFEQIKCASRHQKLSPCIEPLSSLENIAKKLARHGHSDCKRIGDELNALRKQMVDE